MRRAEIAGAGFAGLTAAAALARAGWSVRVHETAEHPRSVGAGIYVFPFAQAVLRRVGAFDAFARHAFAPASRTICVDGERRSVTDTTDQFLTTTRAALHGAVLAAARAAGVEIVTGSHAVGADPSGALLLRDGRRLEAELVLAADGVRSTVAEQLGLGLHRTRHHDGITRVLLDRSGMRGPEWDGILDLYDYRHRPLRLLYTPCGTDAFYFCLMAPAEDAPATAIPVDAALWARSFPLFAPALARIGGIGRHDRYVSSTLDCWHAGRVAVLGDAAHAMPSSLGQGAGVSMLNAFELATAVAAAADVPAGLAAWSAAMRPVVEGWQRRAEAVASGRSLGSTVHPGEDLPDEKPAALAAARTMA